ncbi:MAG: helix-turn-helix domain-containing protein [Clostridiales bacterium]|nr:helix-turn-helix domain-containing protein [Clostridiales bacterium]
MAKGKYQKWLEPDGLLLLEGWARRGLTDEQIAHNIGISRSTLKEWKAKYPAISATLKKSKDAADIQVENALFRRATGYEATETRVEETGEGTKTVTTTKPVPPDVTAQIFWLKNRRPDLWRDKPEPTSSPDQEKAASKLFSALEKEESE